jgi:hypothetical protein
MNKCDYLAAVSRIASAMPFVSILKMSVFKVFYDKLQNMNYKRLKFSWLPQVSSSVYNSLGRQFQNTHKKMILL